MAEAFGNTRVELARYQSMGGVNIALDDDTPANASLAEPSFTVIGLGVVSTISQGLDAADIAIEAAYMDFYIDNENKVESLRKLLYRLEQLTALMGRKDLDLEVRSRIDLSQFDVPLGAQSLYFGAYGKTLLATGIYLPPDIGTGIDLQGPYLDFGSQTELVHFGLLNDLGIFSGYGRRFRISSEREVAVGAQVRGFFRLRGDQVVVTDARVWYNDNIDEPRNTGDAKILQGWGFGLDLYGALKLDDWMGSVFGVYLEDTLTHVWYDDDSTELVTPRLGLGTSIRPLDKIRGNDPLILGIDIENIQSFKPVWEFGAASVWGTQTIHVIPSVGVAFNRRNLFQNKSDVALSTGLAYTIASFRLDFSVAYNIGRETVDGGFYMGVRI